MQTPLSQSLATDAKPKLPRQAIDRQRGEFLRACRARIQPADLGLPEPQRKRTAGLRREDVAALSGVSVAWYTWLEQGREMRVSDAVLERISATFRLTGDERDYLFSLVQRRPPRVHHDGQFEVPDSIERMVKGVNVPSIATNLRWDVLAWNRLNSVVYRDYAKIPDGSRNLVEQLFAAPSYLRSEVDTESLLRRILAKLRVDYSHSGDDPKFEAMIRRLDTVSPTFRRLWREPEINVGSIGINRFTHAELGELAFEHTSCSVDGHPTIRLVLCMPADDRTRRVIAQLAAKQEAS
jgi:transcriptional regulator with XRE-family HTH domain